MLCQILLSAYRPATLLHGSRRPPSCRGLLQAYSSAILVRAGGKHTHGDEACSVSWRGCTHRRHREQAAVLCVASLVIMLNLVTLTLNAANKLFGIFYPAICGILVLRYCHIAIMRNCYTATLRRCHLCLAVLWHVLRTTLRCSLAV